MAKEKPKQAVAGKTEAGKQQRKIGRPSGAELKAQAQAKQEAMAEAEQRDLEWLAEKVQFLPSDDCEEQFRKVASGLLIKNIMKLSMKQMDKAVAGSGDSLKLLLAIATPKKPKGKPEKQRRGPSQAMRLAAEPEWGEETAEAPAAAAD